ncbi:helix-turn-helix transcriptional regulator [Aestuariicella sp. G3-2]|uniref:helix-turn-helix domain-containing protein n=1 Tax=Pseudomaricurvus albidus TaxID=2842452 RepID=UPI001C0B5FCA|nr:helix-turn-helix transcriptional regulator [Aestuariicella albida]MBU3071208.1 helix-turn-helix transcriptional regulator [Aestuariicella albida]
MSFRTMTDEAIAAEIGARIEQMRLEKNLTQQQVADAVGLSRVSYGKLVRGQGKFTNVIAVLRALDALELVEHFVPEVGFSPMELLRLKGRQRQRARPADTAGDQSGTEGVSGDGKQELDW